MSATSVLARFAADLRFEDVPADLGALVKLHVIDTLGCGAAGGASEPTKRLVAFAGAEHAAGPCPVFGSAARFGPVGAAFVNAGAMNALDFDDGLEFDGRGMGHPGATIVAAAMSALWNRPVDGRSFLAAVTAAYEINARVILSMQPSFPRFREVYGVCQHQTIGAAAAYGRLAGLDAAGMENAFGLAGTLASVPSLRKYNWDARPLVSFKDFNAPAAEAGVRAVRLHGEGLVGARAVLDGEHGFWRMLGSDRFDADRLLAGLGDEWLAGASSFKAYPTCRWMHTALESFQSIRNEHALRPEEIETITIRSFSGMVRDFMDAAPRTATDAQFSLPFALANLAMGDRPAARWYTFESLRDPRLLAVAARVGAVVDPRFESEMTSERRRPAGQAVVSARGRDIEGPALLYPLGTRERPLAETAILGKFEANTGASDAARSRLEALLAMDECEDIAVLLEPVLREAA